MPNLTITTGMVPTAAQINANWRDQVVTTCTSATRPSGTEGQFIYETDTDLVYIYNGSGFVQFGALSGWTSYTPTLTQSAAVTKTVTYAKYNKIGREVNVSVVLAVTAAGTAANPVSVTLPVTAAVAGPWSGTGIIYDASVTTVYPGIVALASTTFIGLTDSTAATTVGTYLGQSGTAFTLALASGDTVAFSCTYESAA